ncbi:hypothetical protein [Mycobacterium sp. ZZG]
MSTERRRQIGGMAREIPLREFTKRFRAKKFMITRKNSRALMHSDFQVFAVDVDAQLSAR